MRYVVRTKAGGNHPGGSNKLDIFRSGLADETAQAGIDRQMGRGRGGSAAKGDVRRKSMAHRLGWCEVSFGNGETAWGSYDGTRNRYGVLGGIRWWPWWAGDEAGLRRSSPRRWRNCFKAVNGEREGAGA